MGQAYGFGWRVIRKTWPVLLRFLERLKLHDHRQRYLLGHLAQDSDPEALRVFLSSHGFEDAVLAWKDPGEVLSMRKRDGELFQYHVRLFEDGEIRGHHEYASEAKPLAHSLERDFSECREFFEDLLKDHFHTISSQGEPALPKWP